MKKIEELKQRYLEYDAKFQDLTFQHVHHQYSTWTEEQQKREDERYKEVDKQLKLLEEEYDNWKDENDLYKQCADWSEELHGFVLWRDNKYFWRDWATDKETNERVHRTIRELDEKEIDKFVENGRRVLNSIGYTHDKDFYEVHEFLDYISAINKSFRYDDIDDGGMSYLGMDILENRQLYIPYREDFIECLKKVAKEVDFVFLSFYEEEWGEREEDWEFDEDEYYED